MFSLIALISYFLNLNIDVIMYIIFSPLFIFPLVHSFSPFVSTMHCWKVLQDATGAKRVLHSLALNMVWYYIIFCADVRLFRETYAYFCDCNPLRIFLEINFINTFKLLDSIIETFSIRFQFVITIHVLITIIYNYPKSLNKYALEFI